MVGRQAGRILDDGQKLETRKAAATQFRIDEDRGTCLGCRFGKWGTEYYDQNDLKFWEWLLFLGFPTVLLCKPNLKVHLESSLTCSDDELAPPNRHFPQEMSSQFEIQHPRPQTLQQNPSKNEQWLSKPLQQPKGQRTHLPSASVSLTWCSTPHASTAFLPIRRLIAPRGKRHGDPLILLDPEPTPNQYVSSL